ncbi:MAG: ABC transporter substrate-binding protein [Ruminococcaceae bacterium]|nr:ABC transporter substrate-binding protein [Oscillospiraceae bacterium]
MKTTKRFLLLALALIMALSAFYSCDKEEEKEDKSADETVIRIGGLKGPTTMGLVKLMEDFSDKKTACNYDFKVEAAADALTPLLIKGELDMIAIPANVASVLYNKTNGGVQVLAINTLGVLYIVERGNSISSVADLKGKTIYATGKGTTPEYSLRYILSKNGLDPDEDVEIVWKTEATEVVAQLANTEGGIAMLPQPFVTVAQNQITELEIALNLNDEWSAADDSTSMVTGVTIVRKEFAAEHPELIKAFLAEYKASTEYIVANPAEAAPWVEAKIGVKAPIAQKAIPYCNISHITGADMKAKLSGYLGVLFEQNAQSVGGKLPADDFYYEA